MKVLWCLIFIHIPIMCNHFNIFVIGYCQKKKKKIKTSVKTSKTKICSKNCVNQFSKLLDDGYIVKYVFKIVIKFQNSNLCIKGFIRVLLTIIVKADKFQNLSFLFCSIWVQINSNQFVSFTYWNDEWKS